MKDTRKDIKIPRDIHKRVEKVVLKAKLRDEDVSIVSFVVEAIKAKLAQVE